VVLMDDAVESVLSSDGEVDGAVALTDGGCGRPAWGCDQMARTSPVKAAGSSRFGSVSTPSS
jgi:hypothetical protein